MVYSMCKQRTGVLVSWWLFLQIASCYMFLFKAWQWVESLFTGIFNATLTTGIMHCFDLHMKTTVSILFEKSRKSTEMCEMQVGDIFNLRLERN